MEKQQRSSRAKWLLFFAGLVAVAGGVYVWNATGLLTGVLPAALAVSAQGTDAAATANTAAAADAAAADLPLVTIQAADLVIGQVSASGNIALIATRPVVAEASGTVAAVDVSVGDTVAAGQRLLALDTTDLERAARRAELAVAAAQTQLAAAQETASAAELAVAEANLLEAQENLADVRAGPSAAEIAAARSSLAAAQAAYSELVAGPSQDELTQLSATMKKAEVAVAEAQSAYNQIAWKSDAAASSEAAALQSATIELESARAAYAGSVAAADASETQSAVSSIQSAQVALDDLLASPTAAAIAAAAAQVTDAQAALDDLRAGPDANDVRSAEIALEQALINLEEAYATLHAATVVAPIAGVVTAVGVDAGSKVSGGAVVVTLADPAALELTISVSELDIPQVALGQQAEVTIDALAGQTFSGAVTAIAPTSDESASSVSYPVTLRLDATAANGVRPGMSAVGTLLSETATAAGSWLVPTNSIRTQDGASVVRVMRDGAPVAVAVTSGAVQGEWTVVQADELRAGDQVVGSVTSYVNDNEMRFAPGMGAGLSGGMGGPPPSGAAPMGAP